MANFILHSRVFPETVDEFSKRYTAFFQQKEFIDDVNEIAINNRKELQKTIENAANSQNKAIVESTSLIVGKLENINKSIDNLEEIVSWELQQLNEHTKINNILSANIAELLRIPDIQKERQYYLEQGLKHYKNALINSEFFQDSIENLLKAEQIEKTDYFVLHRIGLIYLYAPNFIDFQKSEDYFKRAAKYSKVESDPRSESILNILNNNVKTDFQELKKENNQIKIFASECLFYTGLACYYQGKLDEAITLTSESFNLNNKNSECGFTNAKLLMIKGEDEKAIKILDIAIKTDKALAIETAIDEDFVNKESVRTFLKDLKENNYKEASALLNGCLRDIAPYGLAIEELKRIETVFRNDDSYINSRYVIDELNKIRKWKYPHEFLEDFYLTYNASIFNFIVEENKIIQEVKTRINILITTNIETNIAPLELIKEFEQQSKESKELNYISAKETIYELEKSRCWPSLDNRLIDPIFESISIEDFIKYGNSYLEIKNVLNNLDINIYMNRYSKANIKSIKRASHILGCIEERIIEVIKNHMEYLRKTTKRSITFSLTPVFNDPSLYAYDRISEITRKSKEGIIDILHDATGMFIKIGQPIENE